MTDKQKLGLFGEELVVRMCSCPRCKRSKTLKRLGPNFKCADVICDFCGYLAQVKTTKKSSVERIPSEIAGAAWKPHNERMSAGIYFPLFLVLVNECDQRNYAIYYLSADLQNAGMFQPRNPLQKGAGREGWIGFRYKLNSIKTSFVQLATGPSTKASTSALANVVSPVSGRLPTRTPTSQPR
ncbi:hypothetical protein JQ580_00185 [Bradyrhizobium japonicum]|nr:hypothetical protein [Bradyrhizobium japonicum]